MRDLAELWEFGVQSRPRLVTCFVTWLDEETGQLILRGQTTCPMFSVAQIDPINLCHHQYFQSEDDPDGILYVIGPQCIVNRKTFHLRPAVDVTPPPSLESWFHVAT